ncbi:hypothetical protein [Desertivirga arenae]|uniref:hypothetical protein n=1 Tax=Desertivirga arenae TaxID=2810309 RepID=UPI001A958DFA|nr:hypothetical protein [Pedobacter sp. SYSU D00823]
MFKKDFIEAELQKLSQVLARIIGLKNDGDVDQAMNIANETLLQEFGLKREELEQDDLEGFKEWLKQQNFSAERLNLLGSILFESIYPFTETPEILNVAHKVALVLNTLEIEYHQQSFENLHRREQLDKFLSNLQYE